MKTFDEYQMEAFKTALPSAKHLDYAILGLASEAGELAGKYKKFLRDGVLDEKAFKHEIGDCIWYIALLATLLNAPLSEIAQQNLDKLADRQRRGALGGNGDLR